GSRPSDQHRPGSYGRSHTWRATVDVFQLALRHLLLPARGRISDLQPRGGAVSGHRGVASGERPRLGRSRGPPAPSDRAAEGSLSEGQDTGALGWWLRGAGRDRKSTRLNSSHVAISYAVFCLKKKNRGAL